MKSSKIKIQFLGAAETVTGSKYLVETGNKKILIDCGLFQGLKKYRLLNWEKLPVDVSTIDFVMLTHGHLDHVGYLPLLVKQGFKGTIYTTAPTVDITKLILRDSAKIQEEEAERANQFKYSKHTPAKPLYTEKEAEAVFPLLQAIKEEEWITIDPETTFCFHYNGHIIGSCFIELKLANKTIVFSGDIGRTEDPLMRTPKKPTIADILVIESTYGNRLHPSDAKTLLANAINKAALNKGTIIIPSFAVERTQLIMYLVWQLKQENKIPSIPMYMDSPMGKSVLDIFNTHLSWHKLSNNDSNEMCKDIKVLDKPSESVKLMNSNKPKLIIASSGMATGGRVLSYFEKYLGSKKATILLVGYQGEGTRGRSLLDGASEIKMRGKFWPVKAKIELVEGLSAHADKEELIKWLSDLKKPPYKVFITHGEKPSSEALKTDIEKVYKYHCQIPTLNSTTEIDFTQ